jgi:predicted amidophosphoribosyltransferase
VPAPPPAGIEWWESPFAYRGAVREGVARLKYRNARTVTDVLGAAMAGRVRPALALTPVDVVTWVPTTPQRRRERGFDQSELLARTIATELGIAIRPLLHRGAGPAQTGRTRAERTSARIEFVVNRATTPARVLLVDDVATTGTTLAAAAVALRAAGAEHVVAVTAARTPPRVLKRDEVCADVSMGWLGVS